MKRFLSLLLIILIAGCTQVTVFPSPTLEKECIDSDGGVDYYKRGSVNPAPCYEEPCPDTGIWIDRCLNATSLLEYSCDNLDGEEYVCPNGCIGGYCIEIRVKQTIREDCYFKDELAKDIQQLFYEKQNQMFKKSYSSDYVGFVRWDIPNTSLYTGDDKVNVRVFAFKGCRNFEDEVKYASHFGVDLTESFNNEAFAFCYTQYDHWVEEHIRNSAGVIVEKNRYFIGNTVVLDTSNNFTVFYFDCIERDHVNCSKDFYGCKAYKYSLEMNIV